MRSVVPIAKSQRLFGQWSQISGHAGPIPRSVGRSKGAGPASPIRRFASHGGPCQCERTCRKAVVSMLMAGGMPGLVCLPLPATLRGGVESMIRAAVPNQRHQLM